MNAHELLRFETTATRQHRDNTEDVRGVVQRSGLAEGLCHVMVMHSTAAVVVNETADPNVGTDIASALERAGSTTTRPPTSRRRFWGRRNASRFAVPTSFSVPGNASS